MSSGTVRDGVRVTVDDLTREWEERTPPLVTAIEEAFAALGDLPERTRRVRDSGDHDLGHIYVCQGTIRDAAEYAVLEAEGEWPPNKQPATTSEPDNADLARILRDTGLIDQGQEILRAKAHLLAHPDHGNPELLEAMASEVRNVVLALKQAIDLTGQK